MIVELNKEYIIGEFIIQDALAEAITSGSNSLIIEKLGSIIVSIFGNEGSVPHIHLKAKNGSFDSCICLHDALYFPHGGLHQDKFTKQYQKDSFDKWMGSINPSISSKTNFEVAKNVWETTNGIPPIGVSIKNKPNYSNLNNDFNENLRKKLVNNNE